MNHDKISVGTYAKNEPASAGLRVLRILYCKKDLICLSIYPRFPIYITRIQESIASN